MLRKARYAKYFVLVLVVFFLDSVIKYLVEKYLAREFTLGFFRIGNYQNPQGLFGLVGIAEIILISIVVFGALAVLIWKTRNESERVSLFLIISGGLMNLFERTTLGFVKDNFAIGNLGYFNFADLVIATGVVIFIVSTFSSNKSRFVSHHS